MIKVGRTYPYFSHIGDLLHLEILLNFSCRFSLLGEKLLLHVRQNDYESENNVSCSTPPAAARGNIFPEAPWLSRNRCRTTGNLFCLLVSLQKYITMHEGMHFARTGAAFPKQSVEAQGVSKGYTASLPGWELPNSFHFCHSG